MSTLERTVSMMKVLPETDLVKIMHLTEKLFKLRECELGEAIDEICQQLGI